MEADPPIEGLHHFEGHLTGWLAEHLQTVDPNVLLFCVYRLSDVDAQADALEPPNPAEPLHRRNQETPHTGHLLQQGPLNNHADRASTPPLLNFIDFDL